MKILRKEFQKLLAKSIRFSKTNWPILAIIFVVLVFFHPVIFQNKIPLPADALVGAHVPWTEVKWEKYPAGVPIKNQEITDAFSQFYPWRSLVGEFWRNFEAPLWNKYMFSGTPFLATWHAAALYPLNFFYLFFSDTFSWTLLVFSQVFFSGVFMYLFLKEIGLTKPGAFLGAISFSFSGYMIAWLEFATGGHAGMWLPLLLLFTLKASSSRKIIWKILIPPVFFFIFTAGDFQVPFYVSVIYILFSIYLAFTKKRIVLLIQFLLLLLTGVLLSLVQLLPTVELYLQSVRLNDPYIKEYFFGIMDWEKTVNFIWPDFFGNVVTGNYWGKHGYHEYMVYSGVVSLVFALASLFTKKLKYEVFFWTLLFLALVFLFPTPLAFMPYKLNFPGLGTSSASRLVYVVGFCLSVLGSYGFMKWQKVKSEMFLKTGIVLLAISLGVAIGLAVGYLQLRDFDLPMSANLFIAIKNMIPGVGILLALLFVLVVTNVKPDISFFGRYKLGFVTVVAILLFSTFDLLRFASKNTPFSPKEFVFPKTKIIDFFTNQTEPFRIAGGIPLNLFMPFKLSSVEGYDPIYPMITSEWFSLVNSSNLNSLSGRYGLVHNFSSNLLPNSNLKYVIDYKKNIYGGISDEGDYAQGIKSENFKEVFTEGRISVFENLKYRPRVWISSNVKVTGSQDDLRNYLIENSDEEIVLSDRPSISLDEDAKFTITNYQEEFNRISFDVATHGNSMVFLSQTNYPGWKAYIDGAKIEILTANYLYQSIPILKGYHSVEFIYDPKSFKIGKYISVFVAILLCTLFIHEKIKNGRVTARKSTA